MVAVYGDGEIKTGVGLLTRGGRGGKWPNVAGSCATPAREYTSGMNIYYCDYYDDAKNMYIDGRIDRYI